jgi:hypothetical protein
MVLKDTEVLRPGEKFDHWGGDTCYSRFSGGLQSRESRKGATVSLIFSRSTVRRAQQISMTMLGAQGKVSAETVRKKRHLQPLHAHQMRNRSLPAPLETPRTKTG